VLDDGLTARWQRQLSPFPYSTKTYSGAFSSGEERSTLIDPSSAVHRDNSGFDSPSPLADSPAPPQAVKLKSIRIASKFFIPVLSDLGLKRFRPIHINLVYIIRFKDLLRHDSSIRLPKFEAFCITPHTCSLAQLGQGLCGREVGVWG
jgi:hypothetical protein